MELEEIKRGLRAEINKRENEQYATFQCNVRQMCKDVLAKLEEQESVLAEKDKEIAELEERIADGDKDFEMATSQNERLLKIVRHHKYKRCLAMAERCESEEKRLEAISPIFDTDKECWEYNSDYWYKQHNRWLKIAEKFKEAK